MVVLGEKFGTGVRSILEIVSVRKIVLGVGVVGPLANSPGLRASACEAEQLLQLLGTSSLAKKKIE